MNKTADRLSAQQVDYLITCLEEDGQHRDALFVTLAYNLGLRVSDVLSLKWEDITNPGGTLKKIIQITEKKRNKKRELKLSSSLRSYLEKEENKEGFIIKKKNGSPLTPRAFQKKMNEWKIDYLKQPRMQLSPHSLRKAFGYRVWDKLGRTFEALEMLRIAFGHTSIDITKRYLGITRDEKLSIYDVI